MLFSTREGVETTFRTWQRLSQHASTTTASIVHHEALKACAIVGQLPDAVEHEVHDLLPDGVMSAGEIVRRVLLPRNELLWVEELPVGSSAYLVHDRWLEVHHDAAGNMLARTRLAEERVESIIAASNGFVTRHLPIRLDTMLQAVELPTSIANLATSLADMNGDAENKISI